MFKVNLDLNISNYHYLLCTSKEAWAWEFIRRDAAYVSAWEKHSEFGLQIINYKEMEEAAMFGLLFFR